VNPARPGRPITFTFDGETVEAREYDTIASALWAAERVVFGAARKLATPRTLLCGEGWCWACAVLLDGAGEALACATPVRDGMRVRSLIGDPPAAAEPGP
jgi:sarcosine oxidase subunit alpha